MAALGEHSLRVVITVDCASADGAGCCCVRVAISSASTASSLQTTVLVNLPDDLLVACVGAGSTRAMASATSSFASVFTQRSAQAAVHIQSCFRRTLTHLYMIRGRSLLIWPPDAEIEGWVEDQLGRAMIYATQGIGGGLPRSVLVSSLVMAVEKDQRIYERRMQLDPELAVLGFGYELGFGFNAWPSVWLSPVVIVENWYMEPEDRPLGWPAIAYDKPSRGILRAYTLISQLHRRTLEAFYLDIARDPELML